MDCITIRWNEFVLLMIIRYKNEFMLRLLLLVNNTHAKFATDNWLNHNHWYDNKIEEYLVKLGY